MEQRMRHYSDIDHLRGLEGHRIALCSNDPLNTISLVLYLREHGCSVLLMPGETPFETALNLAAKADCTGIIQSVPEHFVPLSYSMPHKDEASLYQYSSGTTGDAKLIRRSWKDIQIELDHYNEALAEDGQLDPIILAPVSHSYGLLCGVLSALDRGQQPHIITNKNPKFTISVLHDKPNHLVYGVPAIYKAIATLKPERGKYHKFMSSGAPMPESLFQDLQQITVGLLQQYGCSEIGCISLSRQMESYADLGKPLSHISVETGDDSSNPTELKVTVGGRTINTRDLGFVTDRGTLQFVSRADDVINVGGLNVFPLEVEERIGRMLGVREVVVYRGRHPVIGEMVKAKVVAGPDISPAQVRDWCLQGLPAYKVPFVIECVAQIPKSATGKVSRMMLEIEDGV